MGPNDKTPRVVATYGGSGDTPLAAPFIYRALKSEGGLISKYSLGTAVTVIDLGATARSFATSAATERQAASISRTFDSRLMSAPRVQPRPKVIASASAKRLKILDGSAQN